MARILKDGPPFEWIFTCPKCHAQVQADINDVRLGEFGGDYDGSGGTRRNYVQCPACRYQGNFVPAKLLTPIVEAAAARASSSR